MIDNDEQVRRQKLRALKELRGQVGVGPEPGSDVPSEDITPRRERVREQLRHRRLAGGENTSQPGRGRLQRALTEGEGISGGDRPARGARLREALANRSRHGRAGVGADQSDEPAEPAGRGGRVGNRGMMRRRFSGARRNDGAGRSSHDAQALSELQTLRAATHGRSRAAPRQSAGAGCSCKPNVECRPCRYEGDSKQQEANPACPR